MPIEAIIIVVATVLVLLSLGIWLAVTATKPQLPEGQEVIQIGYGHTVRVRWALDAKSHPPSGVFRIVGQRLARECLMAVEAAAVAWDDIAPDHKDLHLVNPKMALREVNIVFMPKRLYDLMDRDGTYVDHTAAVQTYTPQRVGSGAPLIYISESYVGTSHGSLVVHECLHVLCDKAGLALQHGHEDERVWRKRMDDNSIEERAYDRWSKLTKTT